MKKQHKLPDGSYVSLLSKESPILTDIRDYKPEKTTKNTDIGLGAPDNSFWELGNEYNGNPILSSNGIYFVVSIGKDNSDGWVKVEGTPLFIKRLGGVQ